MSDKNKNDAITNDDEWDDSKYVPEVSSAETSVILTKEKSKEDDIDLKLKEQDQENVDNKI